MEATLDSHIEISADLPGVAPRARVAGRRIRVSDIAILHMRLGLSLAEIAARYDLDMASLHAAMAFYFDHRAEIDASIEDDEAFADAVKRDNPSLLQEKLKALRG